MLNHKFFNLPTNCIWTLTVEIEQYNRSRCEISWDKNVLTCYYTALDVIYPLTFNDISTHSIQCNNKNNQSLELDFGMRRIILDTQGYTMYSLMGPVELNITMSRFSLQGQLHKLTFTPSKLFDYQRNEEVVCPLKPLSSILSWLQAIDHM